MSDTEKLDIWSFINAIHYTKENLFDTDDLSVEKEYNKFVTTRAMSFGIDTIMFAAELNKYPSIEARQHFDYLLFAVRKKKRWNKWIKKTDIKNLAMVKEYFNYNTRKAEEALKILSKEDLKQIEKNMDKGGLRNE